MRMKIECVMCTLIALSLFSQLVSNKSLQLHDFNVYKCQGNENHCFIYTSCKESTILKSELHVLNIPIIYDESTNCRNSHYTLENPNNLGGYLLVYHNILESIVDLMLYWKRFKGVLLADDFSGVDEKSWSYFQKKGIDMQILMFDVKEDILSILSVPNTANFVIICNEERTKEIIKATNESNFFDGIGTWIIVGYNLPSILRSVLISPQSSVTLMIPKTNLDSSEQCGHSILSKMKIDVACQSTNKSGILLKLQHTEMNVLKYKYANRVEIMDIFYGQETGKTELVQFAIWDEYRRLFMLETLKMKDSNQRLKGKMVRAAVFEHKPYSIFQMLNGKLRVHGYMVELVDMLLDTINIRYVYKEVPPIYGIGINGTYTGFVGTLNRKEAEIALNVLAMTNSRRPGIRYTGPVTKGFLGITYNQLEAIMPPTAYLLPFELPVWILILLSGIVIVTMVTIVMIKSPGSCKSSTPSKLLHSTRYRILTGSFFEEVLEEAPGIPTKITFGTLLLTTMLIFIHYTSVFTSFLTSLDVKAPFASLEDAVRNKEYILLYVTNSRHDDAFRNAVDGVFKKVWERIQSDKRTAIESDFESGLRRMYTGKFAYLTEGPTTFHLAANNCNVAFVSVKYMTEFFYLTTRLDFPYSRLLAMGLMRVMEGGIIQRLGEVYNLNRKPLCIVENTSSSLGLNQVIGVFFVWFCGIVLAFIVLCIEKMIEKKASNKLP